MPTWWHLTFLATLAGNIVAIAGIFKLAYSILKKSKHIFNEMAEKYERNDIMYEDYLWRQSRGETFRLASNPSKLEMFKHIKNINKEKEKEKE